MASASPKPTRTAAHPPAVANASASDLAAAMRRSSSAEPTGAAPTSNAPPSPPDSYSTTTVEPRASSRVDLCQDFGHGIERNHAAIGIASGLGSGRSKKASLGSVRSKKSAMASAGTL